jgi:chemotaxis methyl-accepting protein methylase
MSPSKTKSPGPRAGEGHPALYPTAFFRDRELFERLAAQVIPRMLDLRQPDAPIRMWVAGCGSGENA